jgi:hypothetical protein
MPRGVGKGRTNNPAGKPKGTKHQKTIQWEQLRDSLTGELSGKFNEIMVDWANGDDEQREAFVNAFIRIMEFHKPKLARTALSNEGDVPLVQIVLEGKV